VDPDGTWTSTRAVLLAATGQNCWPPAGSHMAATGQDLMAADTQRPYLPKMEPHRHNIAIHRGPSWISGCDITDSSRASTPTQGPSTTPLPTFPRRLNLIYRWPR